MLDTFEKRLASQGSPSPGDISNRDRWSIGGTYKPSVWFDGRSAVALSAVVAAFSGTFTAGTPPDVSGKLIPSLAAAAASLRGTVTGVTNALSTEDRYHLESLPYPPGGMTVRERYAVTGVFTKVTGAAAPSGGYLLAQLGAAIPSLRGTHAAAIFFDTDYSITPAFAFTLMPGRDGALARVLAAATTLLRGTSLPPDSVSGFVRPVLGAATASLLGTMTPPASRDGRLHIDLNAVAVHLRGSVVPPQGNIGKVYVALDAATASLRGTFTPFTADGRMAVQLQPATFQGFGQPLQPGDIYGFMDVDTGRLTVALRGTSVILVGDLVADEIVVLPQFSGSASLDPVFDGSVKVEPIK